MGKFSCLLIGGVIGVPIKEHDDNCHLSDPGSSTRKTFLLDYMFFVLSESALPRITLTDGQQGPN